jgi:hypothetical protein
MLGAWLLGEIDAVPGRRVRVSGTITLTGALSPPQTFELTAAVE